MSTALAVAIAVIVALGVGFALGRRSRTRAVPLGEASAPAPPAPQARPPATQHEAAPPPGAIGAPAAIDAVTAERSSGATDATIAERARILRAFEAETASLRRAVASREAAAVQLAALAEDRARLFADLARARSETARYRQLVVDLEESAPPPLLDASAPDDLKLIVGVGPVLERMLHQLGITTYRQIARWNERDIDDFETKLPEFPGRIRRDAWVTQARALHQSKYGETLPARERW